MDNIRFNNLQTLRFWAALGVLVYHSSHYIQTQTSVSDKLLLVLSNPVWSWGVYLFFVISGFVLTHSIDHTSIRDFLTSRLLRIYPPFLFCTGLVITSKIILFGSYPWNNLGPSLTLLPMGNRAYPLGVEWSLIYEVFFYMLLPLMSIFRSKRLLDLFLLIWASMIVFTSIFRPGFTEFLPMYGTIFFSLFNLSFIAGIIAYQLYAKLDRFHYWLLLPIFLFFSLAYSFSYFLMLQQIFMAISFGSLVTFISQTTLRQDRSADNTLVRFGNYSYGIYLIHVPVITIFLAQFPTVERFPWYILFLLVGGLSLAIGLFYGVFEISFYRRLKRSSVLRFSIILPLLGFLAFLTIRSYATSTTNPNTPPVGFLDKVYYQNGVLYATGWAADNEDGAPVTKVLVYVDNQVVGEAHLGLNRPDVATGMKKPNWEKSGWELSIQIPLRTGARTVYAVATDKRGSSSKLSNELSIDAGPNNPPVGFLDRVSYGNGSFYAQGWAADQEDGTPVNKVEVYIDDKLTGKAKLGLDRPDVVNAMKNQKWGKSGWEINIRTLLSKGSHTVYAVAMDKDGAKIKLGNPIKFEVK